MPDTDQELHTIMECIELMHKHQKQDKTDSLEALSVINRLLEKYNMVLKQYRYEREEMKVRMAKYGTETRDYS